MAEEKNDLEFVEGKYLGKTLATKNAEGTTKKGKKWKKFRVQLQVGEKTWNFNCFDSAKNFGTLQEGLNYSVGYTNYEGKLPDGTEYTSKTAHVFTLANEKTEEAPKKEEKTEGTSLTKHDDNDNVRTEIVELIREAIKEGKSVSDEDIKVTIEDLCQDKTAEFRSGLFNLVKGDVRI